MKRIGLVALLMVAISGLANEALAQAVAKGKNELGTDLFATTIKPAGDDGGEDFNSTEFNLTYARFLTDRFSVGPTAGITKFTGQDMSGYGGATARYYFGNLTRRAIPFAEVRSLRSFNDAFADYTTLQVSAGLMLPMGKTGGRFRIAPYYYTAMYDDNADGIDNFRSFGISWNVALLF